MGRERLTFVTVFLMLSLVLTPAAVLALCYVQFAGENRTQGEEEISNTNTAGEVKSADSGRNGSDEENTDNTGAGGSRNAMKNNAHGSENVQEAAASNGFQANGSDWQGSIVSYAPGVSGQMYDPEYWVSHFSNPQTLIRTEEEIRDLQAMIDELVETGADIDVTEEQLQITAGGDVMEEQMQTTADSDVMEELIADGDSMEKKPQLTADGDAMEEQSQFTAAGDVTEEQSQLTADSDSMEGQIPSGSDGSAMAWDIWSEAWKTENIRYGICVKRVDVKAEPTEEPIWEDENDPYFDDNQLTTERINTPVLIDQETADGRFFHIIAWDYRGWTLAENVAVCRDRQEWLQAQEMEDKLVVTAPVVTVELTGEQLTMGAVLRLLNREEASAALGETVAWGCYVVELPGRAADGSYERRFAALPASEAVSVGFLPFTGENLLKQMFQFLGKCYGWGGMYESVDCSGLVQEVMATFGIRLPRDARHQSRIPVGGIPFSEEQSLTERRLLLERLEPGALLYFPGHIMFYLGEAQGEHYVLSAVGSMKEPGVDGEMLKVRRVVINSLSMERKNEKTWLESLEMAVVF